MMPFNQRPGFNQPDEDDAIQWQDAATPDSLMSMYGSMAESGPAATDERSDYRNPFQAVGNAMRDTGINMLRGVAQAPQRVRNWMQQGEQRRTEMFGEEAAALAGPQATLGLPRDLVGGEVRKVLAGLAASPAGQSTINFLSREENLTQIQSVMSMIDDFASSLGESPEMYQADEFSALAADWLINNGVVPAPQEASGAGGRYLMMDVARDLGFGEAIAFGVEAVMPAYIASLGPLLGAIGGAGARPTLKASTFLSDELRNVLTRVIENTPEELARAQSVMDIGVVSARQGLDSLPSALKADPNFVRHFDEVNARYADDPTQAAIWQRPDVEIWGPDTLARDPQTGMPLLKTPETPNGLTQAQLNEYMKYRQKAIDNHGGLEQLQAKLIDLAEQGAQNPAGEWYPQQGVLDRFVAALGDPIVARAAFENLNDLQAKYSARSTPANQALRATWNFLFQALGVVPAAELNVPIGMGAMAHRQHAKSATRALERESAFDLWADPKTSTYNNALNGNLGDIVADIHYARTVLNDPGFNPESGLTLGQYLALRDLGIEVAKSQGVQPGLFQSRIWVANASVTKVSGTPEPFDTTASRALDEVLEFVRIGANLGEDTPLPDVLRMVLEADPKIADFVRERFPREMYSNNPAVAAEALLRTMNSDDLQNLMNTGLAEGLIDGPSDFLAVISDPMGGVRLLSDTERKAEVSRVANDFLRVGALTQEQHDTVVNQILTLDESGYNRVANSFLNFRRNAKDIKSSLEAGGFTYDMDFSVVPLIRAFQNVAELGTRRATAASAKGYAVGAYPMLGRQYEAGDVKSMSVDDLTGFLTRFMFDNAEALSRPRHGVGGWVSEGKLHLDVVVTTGNQNVAFAIGREANQQAITRFRGKYTPEKLEASTLDATQAPVNIPLPAHEKAVVKFLRDQGLSTPVATSIFQEAVGVVEHRALVRDWEFGSNNAITQDTASQIADEAQRLARTRYGVFPSTGGTGASPIPSEVYGAGRLAAIDEQRLRLTSARTFYNTVLKPIMEPLNEKGERVLTSAMSYEPEFSTAAKARKTPLPAAASQNPQGGTP